MVTDIECRKSRHGTAVRKSVTWWNYESNKYAHVTNKHNGDVTVRYAQHILNETKFPAGLPAAFLNWFYTHRYLLHVQYALYYIDSGQNKSSPTFTETPTPSLIKISSGSTVYNTDGLTNMNPLYDLRAKNVSRRGMYGITKWGRNRASGVRQFLTVLWSDMKQVSKLFRDAATTLSLCASWVLLLGEQFYYSIAPQKFASILQRRNFKIIHITALIINTVKLHLSGRWLAGSAWSLGLICHVFYKTCLEITGYRDQVHYSIMASRISKQAWSKGLDAGTYWQ